MSKISRLDKAGIKALGYLKAATARNNDHPALKGVQFEDEWSCSLDGYQLHAVRMGIKDENNEPITGLYSIPSNVGETTVFEPQDSIFLTPERLQQVITPRSTPKAVVTLNPKYLKDAVTGLDETRVTLVSYGEFQPTELYGTVGKGSIPTFALIMPVAGATPDSAWRPYGDWENSGEEEQHGAGATTEALETWTKTIVERLAEATELVASLKAALAPFAALSEDYPIGSPDYLNNKTIVRGDRADIAVSDLIRAHDALLETNKDQENNDN